MNRKNIATCLLLSAIMMLILACDPILKGQNQGTLTGTEIDLRSHLELLIKDSILYEKFELTENGIRFPREPGTQELWHIYPEEYTFTAELLRKKSSEDMLILLNEKGSSHWSESIKQSIKPSPEKKKEINPEGPLAGLRIALDPGHMAGNMEIAELEGKYVKMAPSKRNADEGIAFFEANLNLGTAHLIRRELERLGAEVFMTRTEAGFSSMGIDYWSWKEEKWDSTRLAKLAAGEITPEQARYYQSKAPEDKIFNHFFVRQDLLNRAKIINAFKPDLSLIIHYNVDAPNWLNRNEAGEFIPTDENYAMAFVAGAFMEGELDKGEDRVDFLRLLLNPDALDASIRLSDLFLKYSEQLSTVPIVEETQNLSYLNRASILTTEPGVYARNLSLSRMIKGPLVYGESLCQDNAAESLHFNKKDLELEGIWVSKRVELIAQAYINAVLEYAKEL